MNVDDVWLVSGEHVVDTKLPVVNDWLLSLTADANDADTALEQVDVTEQTEAAFADAAAEPAGDVTVD